MWIGADSAQLVSNYIALNMGRLKYAALKLYREDSKKTVEEVSMQSEVYTVKDIQQILSISRTTAYQLMASPPFPILKIGKTYRVSKVVFDSWLHNKYKQ